MTLALVPERDTGLPEVVDAATLAAVLGHATERNVQLRATSERWPHETERCRGGRRRLYRVDALPEDVLAALLRHHVSQGASREGEKPAQPPVELALARDQDRETALERAAVVEAWQVWARQHRKRFGSVREAQDAFCATWSQDNPDQALSRATLVRWRKAHREHGVAGLVPGYRARGRKVEWSAEAKLYLKATWLRDAKPSMAQAIKHVRWKAAQEGWALPSDQTMRRYLQGLPRLVKATMREGSAAARACLPHIERRYDDLAPNDVWVADHEVFDCWVIGPNGKVLRPWVTAYQDAATRRIVGRCLTVMPCSDTIAVAFARGCRTNGVPVAVYQDNGPDYSSKRIAGGVPRFRVTKTDDEMLGLYRMLGVNCHFAIPGNPGAKVVERWFGTQRQGFERTLLKGYTGRNHIERPDSTEAARKRGDVLTLAELEVLFDRWVEEVFHRTPHQGQGMRGRTPNQAWNDALEGGARIQMAAPATLALLMGQVREVKVGRQGVRVEKRHFWSEAFAEATDLGQPVVVRYDRGDLGEVQVFDREGRWLAAAQAVGLTSYFDSEGPEAIGHKRKFVRGLYADELGDVRRAARGLVQEELTLGVPTVAGDAVRPDVIAPVRTPLDRVARQVAQGAEVRKAETARARKAAETVGADMAIALSRPAPKVVPVVRDARAELFDDMDRALRGALGQR